MYVDRIFGTNQYTLFVPNGPGDAEPFRFGAEFDMKFDTPELAAAWAEKNGFILEPSLEVPYE